MSRTRTITAALGAAALTLAAAACLGPQALPAQDAVSHYDQVRQDLIEVLGAEDLELAEHEEPYVTTEDGECIYDPGRWNAPVELFISTEQSWVPLLGPVNDVLAEHGFETVDEFDYIGGEAFGISVEDEHGARLEVYTSESSTKLSLHGALIDDDAGCSPEALRL